MKEIIVNSSEDKGIIALVEEGNLVEIYEEYENIEILQGNIYIGKITDVLPGMQAAFVDIGNEKNAFLHIKDILPKQSNKTGNKNEDLSKYNIKDYVKVGMPVLVEVKKDETGKKSPKVSTNLNIAGKFSVIIPNNNFVTVSQKINDENQIIKLKNMVEKLNLNNYGIIVRTSAINKSEKEIQEDIFSTINLYENIKEKFEKISTEKNFKPQLLYEKGNIIKRLLLDVGNTDLERIIVNNKNVFDNIKIMLESNQQSEKIKLELINKENILDIYDLEKQINKILNRKVWLKCGGFITIDTTEALTAIDVNTGKFTGKESIEQTVLKVNKEATIEIVKQLRLRNIGGIIVIDYIDMLAKEDEIVIQELLQENLKTDRAKTQVVGFTKLHLLEMTRKRY